MRVSMKGVARIIRRDLTHRSDRKCEETKDFDGEEFSDDEHGHFKVDEKKSP